MTNFYPRFVFCLLCELNVRDNRLIMLSRVTFGYVRGNKTHFPGYILLVLYIICIFLLLSKSTWVNIALKSLRHISSDPSVKCNLVRLRSTYYMQCLFVLTLPTHKNKPVSKSFLTSFQEEFFLKPISIFLLLKYAWSQTKKIFPTYLPTFEITGRKWRNKNIFKDGPIANVWFVLGCC